MKMITAIIQPFRLDHVHQALSEVGVLGITVTECCGRGHQHGLTETHWQEEYLNTLSPKVMLQLAVPVDQVQTVIKAIIKGARTGKTGDGKIFIAPIEKAVRIRTNERNDKALV
jgi:nitrogen regulatory protein P-II 2